MLNELTDDDPEIRSEVESLLACDGHWTLAHSTIQRDDVLGAIDTVLKTDQDARIGGSIGDFTIREVLGEGGMGTVYRAEQLHPVARSVAIKVIRRGMDSQQVLARFQRERQTLAMMDHPGIARVYDVGSTPDHLPYLAMELVHGRPITDYCDEAQSTIRERLTLMLGLCDAIQHAHQKGIIHRDLKPSNILVTTVDGAPVPKIIDFGIAKETHTSDVDSTDHTAIGQVLGTPEYMSPEQADATSAAIDTRTDIYALGIVLYELLTGVVPFPRTGAGNLALGQLMQDICTQPPPRPSSRIQRSATGGPGNNARYRALRGDLDWIVLRALEKRPADRYATADQFKSDLEAFLDDRPVVARPPSLAYTTSKFVRRNRTAVLASLVVLLSALGGTLSIGAGFMVARSQRDSARVEAQTAREIGDFLTSMLASVDPNTAQGELITVESVLHDATRRLERGELTSQPAVRIRLHTVMGRCYSALGQYDNARKELEQAVTSSRDLFGPRSPETATALEWLATAETTAGAYDRAERNFLEASTIRRNAGVSEIPTEGASTLGLVYHWTGRFDDAEQYFRAAVAELDGIAPSEDSRVGNMQTALGSVLEVQGALDESIVWHRRAVASQRAAFGRNHTAIASSLNNLANSLEASGDFNGARQAHEESLSIKRALLRENHPEIASSLNNLGLVLIRQGDLSDARTMLQEAIGIRELELGTHHASTGVAYANLALALRDQGLYSDALTHYDQAIAIAVTAVGDDHLMTAVFRLNRGSVLTRMGRYSDAEPVLLGAYRAITDLLGEHHRRATDGRRYLIELYDAWDRPVDVARWHEPPPHSATE